MTRFLTSGRSRRLLTLALVGALALFVAPLSRTTADIHLPVVQVEEHWSLLINDPDPDISSPQISTQMARSPWAPRFCNFHLNSCDVPSFAQGGLQLQVWRDSTNLAVVTSSNRATMTTSNELVEWTQYLKLTGASLTFGISSASSQTWGDFSGVQVQIPGGSLLLDEYSADYSQQNSGVTFGANRVSSLVLVWSKVTYADGSYALDSTPRVVFSAPLIGSSGDGAN